MVDSAAIKAQAATLGFDACGIAPAAALPELTRLADWLQRGYAGEMTYMHRSAETRADIRRFLPTARSVIVTATNYYCDEPASAPTDAPRGGAVDRPARIARYARGRDYHHVLSHRLETLVAWMRRGTDDAFDAAIFVDKHHVQERVFARYAGLGWIGKNTCLIHPEIGSWTFLSGVAVSLELTIDTAIPDLCGDCTLCIDTCPTGALIDARELDATKCISYQTIERKGAIEEAQRPQMSDHVFGCDICQEVCPYNLAPLVTRDPAWQPRPGTSADSAADLWRRTDDDLHRYVEGSAMERLTASRLRRNLSIVLGNSGDASAIDVLSRPGEGKRGASPSAETTLVQEHVQWATSRPLKQPA